jgi:hypothetical protein
MLGWECYCVCVMEDKGCYRMGVLLWNVDASWKIRDVGGGMLL